MPKCRWGEVFDARSKACTSIPKTARASQSSAQQPEKAVSTPFNGIALYYNFLCPGCAVPIEKSLLNSTVVRFDALRHQAAQGKTATFNSTTDMADTIYAKVDNSPAGMKRAKEIAQGLLLENVERVEALKDQLSKKVAEKTKLGDGKTDQTNTKEAQGKIKDINEMNAFIDAGCKALGGCGDSGMEEIGGVSGPAKKQECKNKLSTSPFPGLGQSCYNAGSTPPPGGSPGTGPDPSPIDSSSGSTQVPSEPGTGPTGPDDKPLKSPSDIGKEAPCDAVNWGKLVGGQASNYDTVRITTLGGRGTTGEHDVTVSYTIKTYYDKDGKQVGPKVVIKTVDITNTSDATEVSHDVTPVNPDNAPEQHDKVKIKTPSGTVPVVIREERETTLDKNGKKVPTADAGNSASPGSPGNPDSGDSANADVNPMSDSTASNPYTKCRQGKNQTVAGCTAAFLTSLCEDDADAYCEQIQLVGLPGPDGGPSQCAKKKASASDLNLGWMYGTHWGGLGITDPGPQNTKSTAPVMMPGQPNREQPGNMPTK